MSLEIGFFFYWKDCLGVYVSDIKRNQILLLSSTHLNIILRFDFKIAALWQSSRNVLSSFNSNIYAFFVSFFYQGVNSFEKLWKWVLCKTYGLKKCNYMIFTKMKLWSEMKGQVCCNTVYEDQYPQSRIKILYFMYIVLENTNTCIKIAWGPY